MKKILSVLWVSLQAVLSLAIMLLFASLPFGLAYLSGERSGEVLVPMIVIGNATGAFGIFIVNLLWDTKINIRTTNESQNEYASAIR